MRLRHIYGGYISADVFNLLEYDTLKFVLFLVVLLLLDVIYCRQEEQDLFDIVASVLVGVAFWRIGGAYAT